ncbi:hypothetical protein [Streptomyces sp. NPDC047525]|uniref:hypothetical protein n=1 Tax=Streptomyces sp. NPDC047525 TaxID=3155264 RepID=UPI0033CC7290
MYLNTVLYRFTASGLTPESAFHAHAKADGAGEHDAFASRADLEKVRTVSVVHERDPLRDAGAFDGADGGPLSEANAEWLADRLIEEDDQRASSGAAALLLDFETPAPSWLFFGWGIRAE